MYYAMIGEQSKSKMSYVSMPTSISGLNSRAIKLSLDVVFLRLRAFVKHTFKLFFESLVLPIRFNE